MNQLQGYLIKKAKEKDAAAFGKLYENVWQDMYRYALYYLGSSQDAEDAVQDAAIEAFRGIHKFREDSSFKTWMFAILTNKCKKHLKRKITRRNEEQLSIEQSPEAECVGLDSVIEIIQAIDMLSRDEKAIVLLSSVHGFKSREISYMLAMPDATVRSKRSRAIEKIRKNLKEDLL